MIAYYRLGFLVDVGLVLHSDILFDIVALQVCKLIDVLLFLDSNLEVFEGLWLLCMHLLLNISAADVKDLLLLLDVLGICEFIQPLLPFIDLIGLFFGRRVIFFLSLIYDWMLLLLSHWRNIVLYLGINRLADCLLFPI